LHLSGISSSSRSLDHNLFIYVLWVSLPSMFRNVFCSIVQPGKEIFGLYSIVVYGLRVSSPSVFRNVVCSTVHPGEELFGLYSISYMFYGVLTKCAQECRLLKCPLSTRARIFGFLDCILYRYMFYGVLNHVCSGMSSAPLSSRARRPQGSPSPPR
jgi:hypothetical protein